MKPWWQTHPWRMIQTNLRETDMLDINADQLVAELKSFYATVLMISAAGIIANYQTNLPYESQNRYLKGDSLAVILDRCHQAGIKVIARTDFSKIELPVYQQHPEWAYRRADGKMINYNGYVQTCLNGGYQQEYTFKVVEELLTTLPFDGIFYNMSGFQTVDYSFVNHGLCHCDSCKAKFRERFGLELPEKVDFSDPVYQKYRVFTRECETDYEKRLSEFVKAINPEIAINGVDFQRIESSTEVDKSFYSWYWQWQYSASSNSRCAGSTEPFVRASNTSVDFIGYPYRHVSASPHLQELRLWQNLANNGGLDYYFMGRPDTHADHSAYEAVRKVFGFAGQHAAVYKGLTSLAKVLVLRKALWDDDNEMRGWVRMLSEAHIPLDECLLSRFPSEEQLQKYSLVILPDIAFLSDAQAGTLDRFADAGGVVLATGRTGLADDQYQPRREMPLRCMGVNGVRYVRDDMMSAMLRVKETEHDVFPHLKKSPYVAIGGEFVFTETAPEAIPYLSLIPPHRFGPPECCYFEQVTEIPGVSVYPYGKGKGVYIPWKPGTFFYREGVENTAWFMRDVLEKLCGVHSIAPGLTPMVETTLYRGEGKTVVQLVNISGHYGNSYYQPLPVKEIQIELTGVQASGVHTLLGGHAQAAGNDEGKTMITLDVLNDYEAIFITTDGKAV